MTYWDVVIVGAGPAGASAAYDLAAQGIKTLILEKRTFPRLKPCAGGLTIKSLAKLRFSVAHLIQDQAFSLAVGYKLKKQTLLKSDKPICAFTVRSEFDRYCLQQAQEQGAELKLIKGIKAIKRGKDYLTLVTNKGDQFSCRYLIGADGAHSQIRKITGAFIPDRTAVAVEGLLPKNRIKPCFQDQAHTMTLDFGAHPLGYGWLFPKRDHVNVGLFTYLPETAKLSKAALKEYALQRLGCDDFTAIHGYPIATGGEYFQPRDKQVLLVGDAAGMAEPLLGEGIHNAIATGQAAAASVADVLCNAATVSPMTANERYRQRLAAIQKDVLFSRRLAGIFYRCLPVAYPALVRYPVADVLMNGFAAGLTLRDCKNAFGRFTTQFAIPEIKGLEETTAQVN